MKNLEYEKILKMHYGQLVQHLKEKYGQVKGDYFLDKTCKNRNTKITRTGDGLYIHHIDEYKEMMLSNMRTCFESPFYYQKADRLVYADFLEHLLLHIKIGEIAYDSQGRGGINYFIPELNMMYGGYNFKQTWKLNIFNKIKDYECNYLEILEYALKNGIIGTKEILLVSGEFANECDRDKLRAINTKFQKTKNILSISVDKNLFPNGKIFNELLKLRNKYRIKK